MYMQNIFLIVLCLFSVLPAKADVDLGDLYSAAAYQSILNTPVNCHWKLSKKTKKHKMAYLSNGNIVVDGKEYAPVNNDTK